MVCRGLAMPLLYKGSAVNPEAPGRGMETEMNAMGEALNRGTRRRAATALALACVLGLGVVRANADPERSKVLPDDNSADAPEFVVMNGGFTGAMDLSKRPLGKISGTFTPTGASGPTAFCGTFRLPFSVVRGQRELPSRNVQAYYLTDDFKTLIPIQKSELSLGMATVRLELNFHGNCAKF